MRKPHINATKGPELRVAAKLPVRLTMQNAKQVMPSQIPLSTYPAIPPYTAMTAIANPESQYFITQQQQLAHFQQMAASNMSAMQPKPMVPTQQIIPQQQIISQSQTQQLIPNQPIISQQPMIPQQPQMIAQQGVGHANKQLVLKSVGANLQMNAIKSSMQHMKSQSQAVSQPMTLSLISASKIHQKSSKGNESQLASLRNELETIRTLTTSVLSFDPNPLRFYPKSGPQGNPFLFAD